MNKSEIIPCWPSVFKVIVLSFVVNEEMDRPIRELPWAQQEEPLGQLKFCEISFPKLTLSLD